MKKSNTSMAIRIIICQILALLALIKPIRTKYNYEMMCKILRYGEKEFSN